MKIRISILTFTLAAVSGIAQELSPLAWKFQTGDSLERANPSYNDSAWREIQTGTVWESQGLPDYDGFAWYRCTTVIPVELQEKARKQKGFVLRLGKVDDVDETFFNGESVGKTGSFPPDYRTEYAAEREYAIPFYKVRWGKPNVIAVRVYDAVGNGGLYGTPASLTFRGLADGFKLGVAFAADNHILKAAARFSVPARVQNESDETLRGRLLLVIRTDFGDTVAVRSKPVTSRPRSERVFAFELPSLGPGFYLGSLTFESPMHTDRHKFAFGVDPERVVSPPDPPPDFADFWARAKKELAAVAPQFKIIRKDSLCTASREVYLVEMRSLQNVLVRGWYSVPRKPGRYPAFLHVQGYSTNMKPAWLVQDDDFVSFGLNIRGHGNSRDDVDPGFPGYLQDHLLDPECYIYRGAYMDCLRALDFMFSRPEVDTTRVVVEGGSQGGALSFATAALAPDRIRLCVPGVPFLSDFMDYFKVASWPGNEFVLFVNARAGLSWDRVFTTLSYIDIKNLAPLIKAPVLMSVGLLDDVCPPHINFAAYNNLTVPRKAIAYPYAGHGLPGENYAARMAWVREQLGMR